MATVLFYEKVGCGNNTKQKQMLEKAGHQVIAKNLLVENWTTETLRPYFGNLPVAQWFNPAAPRIKNKELDPNDFNEQSALDVMIQEPLLIRRPLMKVGEEYRVGFDQTAVDNWIGLGEVNTEQDIESCPRSHQHSPCKES